MISWQTRVANNFSSFADTYDGVCALQNDVAKKLAELLPDKAQKILEIGCGTGIFTRYLVEKYPKSEIISSDISTEMLSITKKKYPKITTVELDANAPKINEKFDLIVSSMTLHWLEDLEKSLKTISSFLSNDGELIYSTPYSNALWQWTRTLQNLNIKSGIINFPETLKNQSIKTSRIKYKDTLDFLKSIKYTGSGTSNKQYDTLRFAELRKACVAFDNQARLGVDWKICYNRLKPSDFIFL